LFVPGSGREADAELDVRAVSPRRRCHSPSSVFRSGALAGVDVMITIFCDFSQFSAKKLAFFLKTNVMIKSFQNLSLF
jgi:hypothetical protein